MYPPMSLTAALCAGRHHHHQVYRRAEAELIKFYITDRHFPAQVDLQLESCVPTMAGAPRQIFNHAGAWPAGGGIGGVPSSVSDGQSH
jgi:hypothetical protein